MVSISAAGCVACQDDGDTGPGTTSSALGNSEEYQVLGDDFVSPPTETVPAEPGPEPAICIGPESLNPAEAPFGNPAEDDTQSLDWALADFQPQSCGFEKVYGLDSFSDRVTLAALHASW